MIEICMYTCLNENIVGAMKNALLFILLINMPGLSVLAVKRNIKMCLYVGSWLTMSASHHNLLH